MGKKLISLLVLFMILINFTACSSKNKYDETISIVYNGHFYGYENKASIGKAFDKFFKNPKWTSYGDDRPTIVGFMGIIETNDGKIGVACQFTIYYDDTFELEKVILGQNEYLSDSEIVDLINIIYSN